MRIMLVTIIGYSHVMDIRHDPGEFYDIIMKGGGEEKIRRFKRSDKVDIMNDEKTTIFKEIKRQRGMT